MKNLPIYLIAIIFAAITSYVVVTQVAGPQESSYAKASEERESAYERVMRTGTIRCG